MACSAGCGRLVKVDSDTTAVMCAICACKKAGPTENMIKKAARAAGKTGKPKGWHFMEEYVDKEGNVFHKGVEMPKLKGTKEPTVITPKAKLTKFERRQRREARKAKREAKLASRYNEIKKLKKIEEKSSQLFNGEEDGTNPL